MTGLASLTSKNQVTLPVQVVDLSWTTGTRFWVERKDNKVVLEKIGDWDNFVGIFAGNEIAQKYTIEEVIERAKKTEAEKLMHEV